jgi:hypothetical protein
MSAITVDKHPIVGQPGPVAVQKASAREKHSRYPQVLRFLVAAAILLIILLAIAAGYVQKGLWMRQLQYTGVFWTLLSVRWAMFGTAFSFAFLYLWINLKRATRSSTAFWPEGGGEPSAAVFRADDAARTVLGVSPKLLALAVVVTSAAVALLFAISFYGDWDTYLRFRYGGSFGVADPLFGVDVGFYVFHLPFYELLQRSLMVLTVLTLAIVLLTYVYLGLLRASGSRKFAIRRQGHLACLAYCFSFWSPTGDLGSTSITTARLLHSGRRLWSRLCGGSCDEDRPVDHGRVSAVACALLAFNFFRPRFSALLVGSAVYVALYVVADPAVSLRLSEVHRAAERAGARDPVSEALHRIHAQGLPARRHLRRLLSGPGGPDASGARRNQDTIQNIRLWDSRPLLQTYQQTQAIRLYYQFYNVAVDRYHLPDGYHQVMLASRELSPELPAKAQTWVNQYLQFTHGYGLVMNFVSKTSEEGFRNTYSRTSRRNLPTGLNDNAACDLLRRVDAGLSDRCDRHQGVRLPQGQRQCLYQLWRKRGHSDRQLLEKAPVRLDPKGRQHPVDLLPQAGKPHPDLANGPGARGADRSVLAPR